MGPCPGSKHCRSQHITHPCTLLATAPCTHHQLSSATIKLKTMPTKFLYIAFDTCITDSPGGMVLGQAFNVPAPDGLQRIWWFAALHLVATLLLITHRVKGGICIHWLVITAMMTTIVIPLPSSCYVVLLLLKLVCCILVCAVCCAAMSAAIPTTTIIAAISLYFPAAYRPKRVALSQIPGMHSSRCWTRLDKTSPASQRGPAAQPWATVPTGALECHLLHAND